MSHYTFFSDEELACKCGRCDGGLHMDPEFMDRLTDLRIIIGRPFIVTSAYRCPQWNKQVSSTGSTGPHTLGRAIDIAAVGSLAVELVTRASEVGMTGIGVAQRTSHRFIHLDDLPSDQFPRPAVWSY